MTKIRGFEVVTDAHRAYLGVDIALPKRADLRSAGYDFYAPEDTYCPAHAITEIITDVKAYMLEDEVLKLYIRSSLAVNNGLIIINQTGIIDSSYYSNPKNDGNIVISIYNTKLYGAPINAGERFAQGIFSKYLIVDNDVPLHDERIGGTGSSNR